MQTLHPNDMSRIQIEAWKCEYADCGHVWLCGDKTEAPEQCGKCRRRHWHGREVVTAPEPVKTSRTDLGTCALCERRPAIEIIGVNPACESCKLRFKRAQAGRKAAKTRQFNQDPRNFIHGVYYSGDPAGKMTPIAMTWCGRDATINPVIDSIHEYKRVTCEECNDYLQESKAKLIAEHKQPVRDESNLTFSDLQIGREYLLKMVKRDKRHEPTPIGTWVTVIYKRQGKGGFDQPDTRQIFWNNLRSYYVKNSEIPDRLLEVTNENLAKCGNPTATWANEVNSPAGASAASQPSGD